MKYLVILTIQGNTHDGQPLAQYTYITPFDTDGSNSRQQDLAHFRDRAIAEWKQEYQLSAHHYSVSFFSMEPVR